MLYDDRPQEQMVKHICECVCVFSLSHKWPECDPEMTCACQEERVSEWYLLYGTLLMHFTVGRDNISEADKQIDPSTFG